MIRNAQSVQAIVHQVAVVDAHTTIFSLILAVTRNVRMGKSFSLDFVATTKTLHRLLASVAIQNAEVALGQPYLNVQLARKSKDTS